MDDLNAVVEGTLDEIAGELAAAGRRLREVHGSLAASPREDAMLLGEEDPDYSFRARATIECALRDHLEPMLASLRALAEKKQEP